jgi:hypothetical protein|tara:strand:- start:306 stop:698 length:393 start_codon:yes stop_codon:yes gene_type:complete
MSTKPQNWIQGLSTQKRKKQSIEPDDIQSQTNHHQTIENQLGLTELKTHMFKLRQLHLIMHTWHKKHSHLSKTLLLSPNRLNRQYNTDIMFIEELVHIGTNLTQNQTHLTKEQMIKLNDLFQTYQGNHLS